MDRRRLIQSSAALGAAAALPVSLSAFAQTARALCYNCPTEWADWGGMLKLVNQKLNISVPPDNKNSGQSMAALIAEKNNPVADITYLGGQFGPQAREAGVLTPYNLSVGMRFQMVLKTKMVSGSPSILVPWVCS